MNKDRIIRTVFEIAGKGLLSNSEFIHFAQLAKLIDKKTETKFYELIRNATSEDEAVCATWASSECAAGSEGKYILRELRSQLQKAIIELHAFHDRVETYKDGSTIEPMSRISYKEDLEPGGGISRLDEPINSSLQKEPYDHVFPVSEGGYLIVPSPLE